MKLFDQEAEMYEQEEEPYSNSLMGTESFYTTQQSLKIYIQYTKFLVMALQR
jgi:hypothetical protein